MSGKAVGSSSAVQQQQCFELCSSPGQFNLREKRKDSEKERRTSGISHFSTCCDRDRSLLFSSLKKSIGPLVDLVVVEAEIFALVVVVVVLLVSQSLHYKASGSILLHCCRLLERRIFYKYSQRLFVFCVAD